MIGPLQFLQFMVSPTHTTGIGRTRNTTRSRGEGPDSGVSVTVSYIINFIC